MSAFSTSLNSPSTPSVSQSTPTSPSAQSHFSSQASNFAKQKWASSSHQPQLYLATLPTFSPANDAGSSKCLQLGISRPKRKRITPEQLEVLSNLFECTDTPSFDLREAIGSKLAMSNREVQVWFQNRRAKVNRSRIPSNSQVLQEPTIPLTRDASPPSHRRMNNLSAHPTRPGASNICNSDPPVPPLLPPFQATLPGPDSPQDEPMYQLIPDRYHTDTLSPSAQDQISRDSFLISSSKLRPSPPGSRRQIPMSTPSSLNSRQSPSLRSPATSLEDPARPPSPNRSSADLPATVVSDSLTSSSTSSQWNSRRPYTPLSNTHPRPLPQGPTSHISLESIKIDHLPQPRLTSSTTTPPHEWPRTPYEDSKQSVENLFLNRSRQTFSRLSYTSVSIPDSRCASEDFEFSQPLPPWQSGSGSAPPSTSPLPTQTKHNRQVTKAETDEGSQPLAATQPHRPPLTEEKITSSTRSLFSSRFLPPLPNPVRPGPGSFPPPTALRVTSTRKDVSPTDIIRTDANPTSEYQLPPLFNEQNNT